MIVIANSRCSSKKGSVTMVGDCVISWRSRLDSEADVHLAQEFLMLLKDSACEKLHTIALCGTALKRQKVWQDCLQKSCQIPLSHQLSLLRLRILLSAAHIELKDQDLHHLTTFVRILFQPFIRAIHYFLVNLDAYQPSVWGKQRHLLSRKTCNSH